MSPSVRFSMEEPIDILALVRRYRFLIAINLFLAIGFFVGLAFILPPKYKSSGTLTIFSKYFQNPLVRDFLPELTDAIELRAQRENLIRQCFTEDYLNQLGTKFGLFRSSDETQEHLNELEALRKNIEIFPVGATTFTVGFTHKDKQKTYLISKEIMDRVVGTLLSERRASIVKARDSIQRRIEGISLSSNGNPDPMASGRPEVLRKEKLQLSEQIQALETQYTSQHPKVVKLRERIAIIDGWLQKAAPVAVEKNYEKPVLVDGSQKTATKEVFEDLLKKLNYLNIMLDMDQDLVREYVAVLTPPNRPLGPIWPNKLMFFFWGLLSGLLATALMIVVNEYYERTAPSVSEIASELSIPYMGSLPKVAWGELTFMKGAKSSPKKPRKRLEEWN